MQAPLCRHWNWLGRHTDTEPTTDSTISSYKLVSHSVFNGTFSTNRLYRAIQVSLYEVYHGGPGDKKNTS